MTCSYCGKETTFAFVLHENVQGEGPSVRQACFPCITTIGERVMREHVRTQETGLQPAPPDVTTFCKPCFGCAGVRRENCTNVGQHAHTWCDCQ